jgi:hypothetical protein
MPPIVLPQNELSVFGERWHANGRCLSRTAPQSSSQLGNLIDRTVGNALAEFLGGIPTAKPNSRLYTPPIPNCVEIGPMRVEGGIRPQNFDVGYRPIIDEVPDVRFAFDSKTLNDTKSVGKNWQNMVNDIATESATVHSIHPSAIVAFVVAVPMPCLAEPRRSQMIKIFERLAHRINREDQHYLMEALAFVLWDPDDGTISNEYPNLLSHLRIERFSGIVERAYQNRFAQLPPHDTD